MQECTDLITDAAKLLEVLQNFEREVASAKDRAQEAIAELDTLEDALDAAEAKVLYHQIITQQWYSPSPVPLKQYQAFTLT